MKSEYWIDQELEALARIQQQRTIEELPATGGTIVIKGRTYLNFASNDYLDFLNRAELRETAAEAARTMGTGSGSSRLVTGGLSMHRQLEEAVARHKGYPAALLFGSGYLANLGVIASLAGRGDVVVADRLVHASMIDGVRLSGAELIRYHHNDVTHLADCLNRIPPGKRILVITESVFSMDGDLAPLPAIVELANKRDAIVMIDEAHATGVFGPAGQGLIAQHRLQERVNVSMCTLSKALAGYGGVVACSNRMRELLINRARSLIYTTALPPAVPSAAVAALSLLDHEPHLGAELLRRASLFRNELKSLGFNIGSSESQIVPVIVGRNEAVLGLAKAMRDQGFIVSAIRPPTVPQGTSRLRFSITLAHTDEALRAAAQSLRLCADTLRICP